MSEQTTLNDEELYRKINGDTAKISWDELARFFAQGLIMKVSDELDLVEVGVHFARDNKVQLKDWIDSDLISKASMDDAQYWHDHNSQFWATVVMPWVLIQERYQDQQDEENTDSPLVN